MFPILESPPITSDVLNQYQDVLCRDADFEWVSRYVTGLLVRPNKTVQGIYDLQVFPEREQPPSRGAMHEAIVEAGWDAERLTQRHRQPLASDSRGKGRVVISLDWTFAHPDRGPTIDAVKKGYDDVQKGMRQSQTVLTTTVANQDRFDGLKSLVQAPSFETEEKQISYSSLRLCRRSLTVTIDRMLFNRHTGILFIIFYLLFVHIQSLLIV